MAWIRCGNARRVITCALAVLAAATVANGGRFATPVRAATTTTLEFDGSATPWVGSTYYWTVPDHVSKVTFRVYGAAGGDVACLFGGPTFGGLGGRAEATLDVEPGWVFQLNPGSEGGTVGPGQYPCDQLDESSLVPLPPTPGGFNGGGSAGSTANLLPAAGGGGASDVRLDLYGLDDRVIVAGGGGGAGASGSDYLASGGFGGGPQGGYGSGNGQGGGGGSQNSGGYAGPAGGGGATGDAGSFGTGGNGADLRFGVTSFVGGGGGGGWYGGGGGGTGALTAGGGGGGSGHITSSAALNPSDTALYANDHDGPGQIIISYTPDEPIVLPPDVDLFPPTLTLPDDIVVDATSPSGAVVDYSFSATDSSGVATSSCAPASGSTFPIGVTTVTCSATDSYDHTATGTFTVTVLDDTTPPTLTLPGAITVDATSPSGATADYAFSATDEHGILSSGCMPPSGSLFAIGTTVVDCTATDTFGNTTTGSFTVTVEGADAQIEDLQAVASDEDVGTSLTDKLQQSADYLQAGDDADACAKLDAFIHEARALAGKKIPRAEAAALIASARQIEAVIAC
jgi:hypothetical protein